jgi:hypothetical protein
MSPYLSPVNLTGGGGGGGTDDRLDYLRPRQLTGQLAN